MRDRDAALNPMVPLVMTARMPSSAGSAAGVPLGPPGLSPEDRATLARIGPIWGADIGKHREMTVAIYAALLASAST